MTTTNKLRETFHLFILGTILGACQDVEPSHPGADGVGMESSGSADDDDDDAPDDDGADGGTDSGAALGCGNGVVEAGEDCDDDNDDDLDRCLSDCRFGPSDVWLDSSSPTVLPQYGNLGGGSPYDDGCPNGEVITGIAGRAGALIDQVRVECGIVQLFDPEDPEVLELTIVPGSVLSPRGGGGGSGFERRCPEGHAVVGFGGRSGHLVDQITLSCARMTIVDDGQSMALAFEEPFDLQPVGDGGGPFQSGYCGEGEVATIANIRSGRLVDAFGLTCMPISLLF